MADVDQATATTISPPPSGFVPVDTLQSDEQTSAQPTQSTVAPVAATGSIPPPPPGFVPAPPSGFVSAQSTPESKPQLTMPTITGEAVPAGPAARLVGNFEAGLGLPPGTLPQYLDTIGVGAKQIAKHPIESAGALTDAMITQPAVDQYQKAIEAYRSGNYTEALARGIYGTVPMAGPILGHIADQLNSGDVAGAAGTTLAVVAPVLGEHFAPEITERVPSSAGTKALREATAEKTGVKPANTPDSITTKQELFKKAIPPTKAAPYSDEDFVKAYPYLKEQHLVEDATTPVGIYKAADNAVEGLENRVAGMIDKAPAGTTIKSNPIADVSAELQKHPKIGFYNAGMRELENYKIGFERSGADIEKGEIDPPNTLKRMDDLRHTLNQENKGFLKANSMDTYTALQTNPAFAARYYLADSLRNGLYDQLEDLGIKSEGVDARQLRGDEGSLLKVKNASWRQELNGEKQVPGTGKPKTIARTAGAAATRAGGMIAGGTAGSIFGPIGSSVGAVTGRALAEPLARMIEGGENLTRNAILDKVFNPETPETSKAPAAPPTVGQPPMKVAEPTAPGGNFSGALNEGSKAANTPDWVAGEFSHEIDRLEKIVRNPESTAEEKAIAGHQLQHTRELAEHIANPNQGAAEVAPASTVSKMPYDMSYDELDDAIKKEQSKGDDIEKELFGEEDAKRYAKLQRTANSSNAERADAASDEIAKMEDSLTKEQQDRLFGIGEPKSPSVEDLKDFKSALGGVGGWDNAADLGTSLRYAFSRLGNADLSDLSSLSHSEQVAYATLREGFKQAAEEGFDPNEVMQAGLKGAAERFAPEDADFMLKNFVKKNAPETPTVPVLGSKLHFAASKAGLEYKGSLEGGNGQVFYTFDDPTKPGDQITVRESELPATGVADFLKQKMEEKRSAPVGGGKTIEDLRKELLAQTTPKTTTKLLDVPEKLLPKGMNAKSVLNHEIGHMVVGDALGVSQKDIISHLHDDIPEGSAAAARYDPESLGGDARGYYPRGVLEKAFGEKLVPLYTAGGVAQELIEGIPFTENEGTTGDLAILHSVGRELGFSKSQIQDMIEAGKVKAKNILTKPGVLDTINKYASEREIGLSDTLHMSPERVQEMLKGLKKEPNETKNTQANIGRSSKVVPQADFGTTGASSKGNLREGNGKAIQTVNPSAAAGLSALAGSKVASGKSAQPETEEESETEPLDLSAGMEAKEQDIPALLSKASKDYGVPEDLLYAQAMQESKMNPNAESNKGAKGVMQLMDQTSRSLGVTDPKDPVQNVDGGARLMKQLLDRFNGDQEKALASYDWNPASVDKAVQEHGHSWLSYTPKETQTYVRKIMSEKYKQK